MRIQKTLITRFIVKRQMSVVYRCCECRELFADANSLEAHIATVHALYIPFECEVCENALFPTDHSLREHYHKIHQMQAFTVKYKVNPDLERRRQHLCQLIQQSTITTSNNNFEPSALQQLLLNSNVNTTQLLQSCTAQLLKEQLRSNEFLQASASLSSATTSAHQQEANVKMEMLLGPTLSNASDGLSFADLEFKPDLTAKMEFDDDQIEETAAADLGQGQESGETLDTSTNDVTQSSRKRGKRKKTSEQNTPIKEEMTGAAIEDGGSGGSGQMIACTGCGRKVGKYRNSMLIHTSTHHCDQPIFECLVQECAKKWYSLSARTKEHIESKHGGDLSLLKDNRPALMNMLKTETARLFPEFYNAG